MRNYGFHTSKEVLKPVGFQGNHTTEHVRKQEYMRTYKGCFITGDSNTQKDPVKYCLEKWNNCIVNEKPKERQNQKINYPNLGQGILECFKGKPSSSCFHKFVQKGPP